MHKHLLSVLLIAASLLGWAGAGSPAAEIQKLMRANCRQGPVPLFPRVDHRSGRLGRGQGREPRTRRPDDAAEGQGFRQRGGEDLRRRPLQSEKAAGRRLIPDAYKQLRESAKDGKITELASLSRAGGKPAFVRYNFAAPSLKEQGYETQAVTNDGDKDGNDFIVTIVLTANSREAFKAAEPVFLSILNNY